MERAYMLRDAREKERNDFAKASYDLQWREACDDARSLDSKAMTIYMAQERMSQIEEKRKRNQNLSTEENAFVESWKKQLSELESRDLQKQEQFKKAQLETQERLKEQVDHKYNLIVFIIYIFLNL